MPQTMKLKPGGDSYEFLTMGELADLMGRSKDSLKKLTEKGIIPDSNFRTKKVLINTGARKGEYIEGYRLYSKDFLAPMLVDFFKEEVRQGKQITIEQKSKLITMFEMERDHFLSL